MPSRVVPNGALVLCAFSGVVSGPLAGQVRVDLDKVHPRDRLAARIDDRSRTALAGNRHPLARREFDLGRVAPDTRMERMTLVLLPDETQRQAMEDLLQEQQDPQSALYQHWLSPEELGAQFGVSQNDLAGIVSWLEGSGFQVETAPANRRWLVFSGTAGQVESAFHTEIHAFGVNGKAHQANITDPEIPSALASLVGGVVSLHDFVAKPQHAGWPSALEFTTGAAHYLSPSDFATIYDVAPLYSAGTAGTSQAIAVIGRSNVAMQDIRTFRATFGLPASDPAIIVNGKDPGVVSQDEEMEAELDVEWSGAIARNAGIELVVSKSTGTTDGIVLSAEYIVDQNLAPVVSLSFGNCENALGSAGNQFWNSLWQQAAAQGMTVLVAAGDSGAAGCDDPSAATSSGGHAVNGLCSSPYSTCVGGTQFSDTANPALFWSPANSAGAYGSALSYIPEAAWNESGLAAGGEDLWAGGGGPSAIYTKPSWQTGAGVPAANHRYLPDVALASAIHDAYMMCVSGQMYSVSGTSAAAPSFAGLMALTAQRRGGRLGTVNPVLYALAGLQARGGSSVFHDVTTGSNSVPGLTGNNAGVGYDSVTGLGSVDANLLVTNWGAGTTVVPSFHVSMSGPAISAAPGGSAAASLAVSIGGGFSSPVWLAASGVPTGASLTIAPGTLPAPGSGSFQLLFAAGVQTPPGTYTIAMVASGGGLSQPASLQVTVLAKCSYSLGAASASVAAAGGNYSIEVTAGSGCSWTAATTANWIAITHGSPGSGAGQVSYAVSPNSGTASRTGTVTIAGLTFTVTQPVLQCSYSLGIGPVAARAGGYSGTVSVTAPAGCAWTASSNSTWITIPSGNAGSGTGKVSYAVSPNTAIATRTGSLLVAGIALTVTEPGRAAPRIVAAATRQ